MNKIYLANIHHQNIFKSNIFSLVMKKIFEEDEEEILEESELELLNSLRNGDEEDIPNI